MTDKLPLFTLVIDYRGGTYIIQASAENKELAQRECVLKWLRELSESFLTEDEKRRLLEAVQESEFLPLNGVESVWCGTVIIDNHLFLMNLIETKHAM